MKLENQVVSLELAKKLKELGVKQDSLFYWGRNGEELFARTGIDDTTFGFTTLNAEGPAGDPYWFDISELDDEDWFSAFTVAELGEMLPAACHKLSKYGSWLFLNKKQDENTWICGYGDNAVSHKDVEANTMVDATASMLIYLIENNLITISNV